MVGMHHPPIEENPPPPATTSHELSDIAGVAGISVFRDGGFLNLGFVQQHQPQMLVFLESDRYLAALQRNQHVSAVLTRPEFVPLVPRVLGVGVCSQPRLAFAEVHNQLAGTGFYWQEFPSVIAPDARVHPTAWVARKNVRIGARSVVEPHATILERCLVGEDVVVGAGAVLGGVGFQTARTEAAMVEMKHAGGLVVGDRVLVLPGAVIATGLFRAATEIAQDVRIGSQAFVSHAVRVGERSFVGHGAVVNGNVVMGAGVWIGPGAVIANDLEIGPAAFVSLGAVVIRDLPAGSRVSGNFAGPHRRLLRKLATTGSE
jgi:UDP-3-O-[3-hydroxymyristoyl] glucosamine N-acyltransferase